VVDFAPVPTRPDCADFVVAAFRALTFFAAMLLVSPSCSVSVWHLFCRQYTRCKCCAHRRGPASSARALSAYRASSKSAARRYGCCGPTPSRNAFCPPAERHRGTQSVQRIPTLVRYHATPRRQRRGPGTDHRGQHLRFALRSTNPSARFHASSLHRCARWRALTQQHRRDLSQRCPRLAIGRRNGVHAVHRQHACEPPHCRRGIAPRPMRHYRRRD
jgi:hypothetical protein